MKPVEVKPLDNYKIWIRFSDGVQGEISLKELSGKGVFGYWNNYDNFRKVYIDAETESIAWNEDLDICPSTIYKELTQNFKWNA